MWIQDRKFVHVFAAALIAVCVALPVAHADDDDDDDEGHGGWFGTSRGETYSGSYGGESRGGSARTVPINAKFQQECSSCHIAYVPRLLPAESWRNMMAGLDKHFGTDASLDDKDNNEITAFLVTNASRRPSSTPTPPLRISETAWFRREHNERHVKPAVWKNPQVKSPANCAACHPRADLGKFNEHEIRIPR